MACVSSLTFHKDTDSKISQDCAPSLYLFELLVLAWILLQVATIINCQVPSLMLSLCLLQTQVCTPRSSTHGLAAAGTLLWALLPWCLCWWAVCCPRGLTPRSSPPSTWNSTFSTPSTWGSSRPPSACCSEASTPAFIRCPKECLLHKEDENKDSVRDPLWRLNLWHLIFSHRERSAPTVGSQRGLFTCSAKPSSWRRVVSGYLVCMSTFSWSFLVYLVFLSLFSSRFSLAWC
jgi:hypothetical protein